MAYYFRHEVSNFSTLFFRSNISNALLEISTGFHLGNLCTFHMPIEFQEQAIITQIETFSKMFSVMFGYLALKFLISK